MSALQWFVIIQAVVGSMTTIAMIGKERKPTTPGVAVVVVAINLGCVVLALTVLAP